MQPGHKSGQRLFLILNEARPVPGRDGGGVPTFPGGAGGHSGLRKRRVAPTSCTLEGGEWGAFVGHWEGAELCLSAASSLGLPWSCISPCRLQLWREQPCSFPCPRGAGAGGRLGARSHKASCSQTPAGTTEGMCKKIRGMLVPEDPGEVSREKAITDLFFPTPCHAKLSYLHGSQPRCEHLLGHLFSTVSQNSPGCLIALTPEPAGSPCWAGRDRMVLGIAGISLT